MNRIKQNEAKFAEIMKSLPVPTQKINHFQWGQKLLEKTNYKQFERFKDDYCDIWIWEKSEFTVVLLTQNDANPSMSITNASELIASSLIDLLPKNKPIKWFESYECYLINNEHHFDEITYQIDNNNLFCRPQWKFNNSDSFKLLIS